jgi:vancomycin resistance protein YoaR
MAQLKNWIQRLGAQLLWKQKNSNVTMPIVHTSGAAKATVYVNSSMRARASGASRITYKGSPAFKIKNISGAATIEPHE